MKRMLSLLLVLALMLIPLSSEAANEVYVGINNAMLPLTDTMPLRSGGVWYIDYLDFTRGDLGINASYNAELGTVVLYNWDITLVFQVGKGTATCAGKEFKQSSFAKNGTIYVPASFAAEQFGVHCSYLSSVSTLRLRSTSSMSDSMFVYIAQNRIPDLLAAYNASKQPSQPSSPGTQKPGTQTPSSNPDESTDTVPDDSENSQETPAKSVYITIDIKRAGTLTQILNLLGDYNLSATLFVGEAALPGEDNTLRRICASRHALGVYADTVNGAESVNAALYAMTKTKSRLLRGDASVAQAEAAGYRPWGANVDVRARTAAQTIRLLDARGSTVLRFDDSESSIARMKRVFSHISERNFSAKIADVTTTPVAP